MKEVVDKKKGNLTDVAVEGGNLHVTDELKASIEMREIRIIHRNWNWKTGLQSRTS